MFAAVPTAVIFLVPKQTYMFETVLLTQVSLLHEVRSKDDERSINHASPQPGQDLEAVLRAVNLRGCTDLGEKCYANELEYGTGEDNVARGNPELPAHESTAYHRSNRNHGSEAQESRGGR